MKYIKVSNLKIGDWIERWARVYVVSNVHQWQGMVAVTLWGIGTYGYAPDAQVVDRNDLKPYKGILADADANKKAFGS